MIIYTNTDYNEDYRGQYHFSSKCGFLDDINGLWFDGSYFHMCYQHNTLDFSDFMYWGHTKSKDMLHWKQLPVALDPHLLPKANGSNYQGCTSGSTIVDFDNTSSLKTGVNPVLCSFYGAGKDGGLCLVYSNDNGDSWQWYEKPNSINGAIIDINMESGRDPHVFKYLKYWVMALFRDNKSIEFYRSGNLKDWVLTSADFSSEWNECPDIYEIAVDGDNNNKKWVLQDGPGKYRIGSFDGYKFVDESPEYRIAVGPDFYSSQTFYRDSFPDDRVIQFGWLSIWNTPSKITTSPWDGDTTFPCEIKLKTINGDIRAIVNPIGEINKLYGYTKHWGAQIINSETDLLNDFKYKCVDIEAEFELKDTTANNITFTIADKKVKYNIKTKELIENLLEPINNRIKIRILADMSQLEIFVNDGILRYCENYAFQLDNAGLHLTTDGDVSLVSLDFRQIKRTWEGLGSNLGADWTSVGKGDWSNLSTSDGLIGESNNEDNFYISSTCGDDFIYQADLKVYLDSEAGLTFRTNLDVSDGYCVSICSKDNTIKLRKLGTSVLAEYNVTINQNDIYCLKVVLSGANIKVYLDNSRVPVIDYTDCNPITEGHLGVSAQSGTAVFQHIYKYINNI